jgi:hypothetical protein
MSELSTSASAIVGAAPILTLILLPGEPSKSSTILALSAITKFLNTASLNSVSHLTGLIYPALVLVLTNPLAAIAFFIISLILNTSKTLFLSYQHFK